MTEEEIEKKFWELMREAHANKKIDAPNLCMSYVRGYVEKQTKKALDVPVMWEFDDNRTLVIKIVGAIH